MTGEVFEICFNLIGAFLSFIPILPLTLDFMVKMLFEKMPGILIHEFPNTNKIGMGFYIE